MTAAPSPLPLSLPAGVRSKRRGVYAVGVVTLEQSPDQPGYIGNWQPIKPSDENPTRKGASWLAVDMIDWSTVG